MTDNYNNEVTVTEVEELATPVVETHEVTTPEQPVFSVPTVTPTVSPFAETTTDDKSVSTAKMIIGGVALAGAGYGAVKGVKWVLGKIKAAREEKAEFRKWKEAQKQTVVEPHEVPETDELDYEKATE